jgi:hypothetical protein
MRTSFRSSLVIIALAVLFVVFVPKGVQPSLQFAASGQQSPSTQPELSLSLRPVQDVVQSGSPVNIEFTSTNVTDHLIQYSCWIVIPCALEVRDQDGNEPPETELHRRFEVNDSPNVAVEEIPVLVPGLGVLRPGEAKTNVIDVDGWCDFSKPGTYTMQVVRRHADGATALESNQVTIKVVQSKGIKAAAPAAGASTSQPPFGLSIRLDSKPGFPVGFTVRTTNTSDHRILLRTLTATQEHAGYIYKIDVRDNDGVAPYDTQYGLLAHNQDLSAPPALSTSAPRGDGQALSLKPGETWADCIMPRTVFALNKPGPYTIQVRRWDDETKTWVGSNIVTVTLDQEGRVQRLPSP